MSGGQSQCIILPFMRSTIELKMVHHMLIHDLKMYLCIVCCILNDLESFLCDKSCNDVNFEFQYDDITLYLKLLVLVYTDDTIVFGTDEKEIKNNLDMFYEYSELWNLSINFDKTRIMIFGTRQDQRCNFNLGGHNIAICTDFKYLGVIFSRNRHFHQTRKHNIEQARKSMHVLFKRMCNLNFPIDLQLYFFDNVILPIA